MKNRVAIGTKFQFQTSIVGWIDLLGYGAQIKRASYLPTEEDAVSAHERLKVFHKTVAENSRRNYPSLVMNDGAIFYRDLSYRCPSVTYEFILRSWKTYNAVNEMDFALGHPGARMVIAAGFRVRGRRAGLDTSRGHLQSIISRLEAGTISSKQAVHEAMRSTPRFDTVPQLQSNYAFTKAYAAESAGSAAGFKGPGLFIDLALLSEPYQHDVIFSECINWKDSRLDMQGNFGRATSVADKGYGFIPSSSYHDGLEVAKNISGDSEILLKLRKNKTGAKR
ncbi:MAG: hypothetical protein ABNH53_08340 [Henriciella sp.]|jgi:hypothetical protein